MKYIKHYDKNGEEFFLPMPETKDEIDKAIEILADRPLEKLDAMPNELLEEWRAHLNRVRFSGLSQVEIIKEILNTQKTYID